MRLYVRTGTEHVDRGDHTRALPWFLKAFELEQDDPDRAKIHQLRIAMTLDRCPKLTRVLWPEHVVDQIQFFADGRRILLTGGRQASVWDIQQGVHIDFPLVGRYHRLGPLGQRIVVFRNSGLVCVLDGESGEVICRLPKGPGRPSFAGFSRDASKLFVVYGNRALRVWDPNTGKPLSPLLEEPVERIVGATFNSDARYLIASDNQPRFPDIVLVWDLESNQVVQRIPVAYGFNGNYAQYVVAGLDWFAVPADAFVFVAPLPNGNRSQAWLQHSDQVRTLRISDDASMLLSSSIDNTVRVWYPRSRSPLTDYLRLDASIYAADFSPDGRTVAAGAVDGRVAHWKVKDGQLASPTLHHPDRIRAIRFGPQNRRMLTASKNGGVRVWDLAAAVAAPELEREQSSGAQAHAAFCNNGRRLMVSFMDYSAQIYDLATKAYVKPLIEHQDLNTLTRMDPTGKRIYSVCRSGEIGCADLEKGEVLFRSDRPMLPPVGVKGEPVSITTRGRPYLQARTLLEIDPQRNVLYAATGYVTSDGNPNIFSIVRPARRYRRVDPRPFAIRTSHLRHADHTRRELLGRRVRRTRARVAGIPRRGPTITRNGTGTRNPPPNPPVGFRHQPGRYASADRHRPPVQWRRRCSGLRPRHGPARNATDAASWHGGEL